ncbi:amine oxidase [Pseudarthrobacter chlorophenolicus A6]|uniref:Amine oxidase n=1 Tax=Pseudarthrobacter chlorophenolicus (strain ATCC 700700 / DSM 12829 / CIP 107037 / JCM 12360 / KCTC 9906 / NCIMB 13794 / A6) TaxID=452863 RepID=B8HER1_PSECP|nr:NAD(P)/FAD-dependent oxidoreductase [Pseudarthrobacter chlorophenolicus]ACL39177.1 amine oxidase [Pseudarthrobacter chlorophenolicus A6]SDR03224.1 tryptophan 2-monooxygenase [Pseudarthrobacter chlorophenolicus]
MTTATELPASDPSSTSTLTENAPRHPQEQPAPITMLNPDFPFSYDHYLAHPGGLGAVPDELLGTEVAVIGAGLSGLVTAYELMKLGLRPVVYEADQIGGRLRTANFPAAPGVVADLGGMRFPVSGKAFYHYVDLLGLETQEFPNPLSDATSSTVIELAGKKHYAEKPGDLPPFFREVADAWKAAVNDGAKFGEMQDAIRRRDTARIKELWNELLPLMDEQTFYGFIAASDSFKAAGFAHREAFGQVGFGTGGWDTDFPNSILEILRVVYTDADDQHRLIRGGAQRLPEALWQHAPSDLAHWPAGTSLASLHSGSPRGAVGKISRDPDGNLRVRERWGREASYPAVVTTCQSWLLSTRIHTEEALFPAELWTAIERSHYMQSSKTFVMVDRPFWKDIDPETGNEVLSMTLTDRLNRATYLLDNGPDQPAVILLSYTWNDDALKWLALDADERVELMLHSLEQIYPGVDIAGHIVGQPITVSWEADPNFMGAFKANLPGQYRYQQRLFTHFKQDSLPESQRGIFLAGDDVSFTAGWAEGAVTTGLNAVWGVVKHLGGSSAAGNPGPGDLLDELGPISLDG